MNLRPAVFFPLCALGLAAAFWAGYAVRGGFADHEAVESGPAVTVVAHVRNPAGGLELTPFVTGQAEDWVRKMDDRASKLSGQRMRIYAAQQCAQLDQNAAIELIRSCESHYHEWTCGSSAWSPDDKLLEELMRNAIVRLSDLNPDRALEFATNSAFLSEDDESAITYLEPLVTKDPAKVAEFLKESRCDVRGLLEQLSRITDLRERPDILDQYLPVCREDSPALGMLLDLYAGHDQSKAFNIIANDVCQKGNPVDYDLANGLGCMDSSYRERFAEWSLNYSGPQAEQIQAQALQSLLPEMGSSPYAQRAVELFNKLIPGQSSESQQGIADLLVMFLGRGSFQGMAGRLDQIEEVPVRQAVLEGVCQEQLDEMSKGRVANDRATLQKTGEWIRQIDSPVRRDALTANYVRNLERGGSAEADQWADGISEPALKESTQKWLQQNRELDRLLDGK